MRTALALTAALALVAPVLSGCGESGEKFRKSELLPVEEKYKTEKARLSATLRTVRLGSKRDANLLHRQIDAVAAAGRRIGALDAPGGAEDELQAYNSALVGLVAQLRRFADALAAGDKKRLNRTADDAQEAAGRAFRAERALKEKLT